MTIPFGAIVRAGVGLGRLLDDDGEANKAAESALAALKNLAATGPVEVGAVVKFEGVAELLDRLGKNSADLRPVFASRIDPSVTEAFVRQFASEGKELGTPWPRLSVTTIRLRTRVVGKRVKRTTNRAGRARYGFSTVLRDTGRLAASFTTPGGPEGVRDIQPLAYARGSSVPYAALHQEGFSTRMFGRGSPKMVPARPIVPAAMPAPLLNSWEGYLVTYLETGTA